VIRLYESARKVGEDVIGLFPAVLKQEFPLARPSEIRAMLRFIEERIAADEARRAKSLDRWSALEKQALTKLFSLVDVNGDGSLTSEEFQQIASLAEMSRSELRDAFDKASELAAAGGATGAATDNRLDLASFCAIVESLPPHNVRAIRRALPGILTPTAADDGQQSTAESALVFDDGRQQLWRLRSTSSRSVAQVIVRKDTREAEWRSALGCAS